jgi:hypothetical protein
MASVPDPDTSTRTARPRDDAGRYRAAAEATLDQLDWCIEYLHRIRKPRIAAVLAQNRSEIRKQLT